MKVALITGITGQDGSFLAELLLEKGARRVVPLAVSGAFHSKFMEKAGQDFASFVSELTLNDTTIPVVTNVDALATTSAEDFRQKIKSSVEIVR